MRTVGEVFGMTVRAADSAEEWSEYVRAALQVQQGESDPDLVIDERHALVLVNPNRAEAIMERLRAVIPESA